MSITWQEELTTGVGSIDTQHKEIFARFELFSAACADGVADGELLRLIEFLEGYTRQHFRDEEEAMTSSKYPRLDEQHEAHSGFLEVIVRLKSEVAERGATMESTLEAKRAMVQWLINHIRQMDKEFAAFLTA